MATLVGLLLACCVLGTTAGCGSDSSGSSAGGIETRNPEVTFAPLVQLHPKERWLPMDANFFLDRSIFGFADDQGCTDRPIAVGRELEDLWTPAVDWLGERALGTASGEKSYYRTPYAPETPKHDPAVQGTECPFREGYRYFANQQTRLYEPKDRVEGLRLTEGYYLDLVDRARRGPRPQEENGAVGVKEIEAPVYAERHAEDVDGEPGLRLTYWLLYGMNEPLSPQGDPIAQRTHEGDWERIDVLLQEGGGDDEWVPVTVRVLDADGHRRDVRWASIDRTEGADDPASSPDDAPSAIPQTHPVLTAAHGDHTLSPAPRRGDDCATCPLWPTWSSLEPARKQPWYGFGGAWGQPGKTSETTGPHGPHGKWAPDSPFNANT